MFWKCPECIEYLRIQRICTYILMQTSQDKYSTLKTTKNKNEDMGQGSCIARMKNKVQIHAIQLKVRHGRVHQ